MMRKRQTVELRKAASNNYLNQLARILVNGRTIARLAKTISLALSLALTPIAFAQPDSVVRNIERYTALYQLGQYAEAESMLRQTIAASERESGKDGLAVGGLRRDLGELHRVQGEYTEAEQEYLKALTILENALGDDHPEIAVLLLELTEIFRLQRAYSKAQATYSRAIQIAPKLVVRGGFELVDGRGALTPSPVYNSVVDFFDREHVELADYGRYTYVLIPSPSTRSTELISLLLVSTPRGEIFEFDRKKLNVFYIPVKNDYQDAARGVALATAAEQAAQPIAIAYYDYDFAAELLTRLCDASYSGQHLPSICASSLDDGPYLVTFAGQFARQQSNPHPYLLLDLSGVHADAFDKFINALKVQIKGPDFTEVGRIAVTRLALLNIILKTADLMNPIKTAVADVFELVEPGSGK